MKTESVKEFLKRKNVNITVQTYLIDALGAMAFGLFASLLIGTIFGTLGQQFDIEIFNVIADYAKSATGAALGIAIAHALKAPQLVLFSAATVGIAGNTLGGPVGALVATIIAAELGKIVSKETRLDIIVTPGITIISGVLVAQFVGPGVAGFMNWFGNLVKTATEMQPFIMGILVSALIGVALTLPISSAAICIALSLDGLAGGAATAGCCAQMIGFAVMSYRENKVGQHAADGQYCAEPPDLDPAYSGIHDHRPCCNRGLWPKEHSGGLRYGHLRPGGPHRRLHRHGRRRPDVAWDPAGLLCAPGSAHLYLRGDPAQDGMDQRGGSEAGSVGLGKHRAGGADLIYSWSVPPAFLIRNLFDTYFVRSLFRESLAAAPSGRARQFYTD